MTLLKGFFVLSVWVRVTCLAAGADQAGVPAFHNNLHKISPLFWQQEIRSVPFDRTRGVDSRLRGNDDAFGRGVTFGKDSFSGTGGVLGKEVVYGKDGFRDDALGQNGYSGVSSPACQHDKNTFRCVRYISNYDGDTIRVHIPGLHPLIGKNIRVRLLNVDTFEIKSPSKCKKREALRAKNLVAGILKKAKRIDLHHIKRGNFFRIVADVKADGVSLGDSLLKAGLAVPLRRGKTPPTPCPLPLPGLKSNL